MYLLGSDTHHARTDNERYAGQFHIMKVSEGKTFTDKAFTDFIKTKWNECPHLIGGYHFLSEKSNICEQIKHFVSTAEPLKGQILLALDYEARFAEYDPNGKCLDDAIDCFMSCTKGMQPVVYMNKSEAAKIAFKRPQIMNKASLWLADYSGNYKGIWTPMIRQVCSDPFDIDVFYGSEGSWKAIANTWK